MSTQPERAPAPVADEAADAGGSGWAARWRSVCGGCRQLFGIPDYERYLAHAAARHPGAPVLSREEFSKRAIDRRYGGGGGMRCC
ncbi:YbdD/YjiX family protein [uncultured Azohydromonas sp.]|jgi:Uncharacterized small protein|uniref:YbdD/YjiX family protein n=1 Tax=uncultured Azohydromonas sp. TaxID=487342 RepID=UPI002613334C|nr:YbdD/YjiX family protein [uncultured Azohydromonas sp.]